MFLCAHAQGGQPNRVQPVMLLHAHAQGGRLNRVQHDHLAAGQPAEPT